MHDEIIDLVVHVNHRWKLARDDHEGVKKTLNGLEYGRRVIQKQINIKFIHEID